MQASYRHCPRGCPHASLCWQRSYKIGVGISPAILPATVERGCAVNLAPTITQNKGENSTARQNCEDGYRVQQKQQHTGERNRVGDGIPPFPLVLLGVAGGGGGRLVASRRGSEGICPGRRPIGCGRSGAGGLRAILEVLPSIASTCWSWAVRPGREAALPPLEFGDGALRTAHPKPALVSHSHGRQFTMYVTTREERGGKGGERLYIQQRTQAQAWAGGI